VKGTTQPQPLQQHTATATAHSHHNSTRPPQQHTVVCNHADWGCPRHIFARWHRPPYTAQLLLGKLRLARRQYCRGHSFPVLASPLPLLLTRWRTDCSAARSQFSLLLSGLLTMHMSTRGIHSIFRMRLALCKWHRDGHYFKETCELPRPDQNRHFSSGNEMKIGGVNACVRVLCACVDVCCAACGVTMSVQT
jgi:hypothetical protein